MNRFLVAIVLVSLAVFGTPASVSAAPVACGTTITQNTVLKNDLKDCPGGGITFDADNITLDLNGHAIDGDGSGVGVGGFGVSGITLKNGTVMGFEHNIQFQFGSGITIKKVKTRDGVSSSLYLINPSDCTISKVVVSGSPAGIGLQDATGCRVSSNRVSAESIGIELFGSTSSIIVEDNQVTDTPLGMRVAANSNRILRNTLKGNGVGINVQSSNNRVIRNSVSGSTTGDGIVVDAGLTGTSIVGNTSNGNADDGIDVPVADPGTSIASNVANANTDLGITADPAVDDAGGNRAKDNGNFQQCVNIACE